jgi:hypothetical protein
MQKLELVGAGRVTVPKAGMVDRSRLEQNEQKKQKSLSGGGEARGARRGKEAGLKDRDDGDRSTGGRSWRYSGCYSLGSAIKGGQSWSIKCPGKRAEGVVLLYTAVRLSTTPMGFCGVVHGTIIRFRWIQR